MNKIYVYLLAQIFLMLSTHILAQADNYKKHVNDETEQVSEQEMTFYLVFKSHFDIGYSALARDVIHEYRTSMIDKAMDVIDRNLDKMSGSQFVYGSRMATNSDVVGKTDSGATFAH